MVLLGLAAEFLRRPDVLLLDEPTSNLGLEARRGLFDAVASWPGMLVMVSHDRALLELADQIADLRDGALRWYGGNLAAYEDALAGEQEAAARRVRVAESDVRRQQRELGEARIKLDRRQRYGRKMWAGKREPKVVMGERKRQAQVSAGKHRIMQAEKVTGARERLTAAAEAIRDDTEIRLDLPETVVPGGRDVVTLSDTELRFGGRVTLRVRGPERIALVGANGAGKTTLLRTMAGTLGPVSGLVKLSVPARHLPQRLDLLDDQLTVAQRGQVRPAGVRKPDPGQAGPVPAAAAGAARRRTTRAQCAAASRALRSYPGALVVARRAVPARHRLTRWSPARSTSSPV